MEELFVCWLLFLWVGWLALRLGFCEYGVGWNIGGVVGDVVGGVVVVVVDLVGDVGEVGCCVGWGGFGSRSWDFVGVGT